MITKNKTKLWIRLGMSFLVVILILLGARIVLADPPVATSANYRIFRDVEAGAGSITSTNYKMTGIVGEPTEVGWVTSASYKLRSAYGFLGGGGATAVTLARFVARAVGGGNGFTLPLAVAALGAVGLLLLRARRRQRSPAPESP